MDHSFLSDVPEWQLHDALARSCGGQPVFWTAPVVRIPSAPDSPTSLAHLLPGVEPSLLKSNAKLPLSVVEEYGLPSKDSFRSTLWSLQPDLLIESADKSLLVILEAKAGSAKWRIGKRTKEDTYYQLLGDASRISRKGFFFIAPYSAASDAFSVLTARFSTTPGVLIGLIVWEDLFPRIGPTLCEVATEDLLRSAARLAKLREHQRMAAKGAV